jgi:hypothetical protein
MNFDNPVSFAANTVIEYGLMVSDTSSSAYRVFIYDTDNRYVSTNRMSLFTTWASAGPSFSPGFLVPAGETYTVTDVISKVKKVVWVFDYRSSGTGTKTFNIYIDRIMMTTI